MKKIVKVIALVLCICTLSTTVFAQNISQDLESNLRVGDLYENESGQQEKVIAVNADKSFTTMILDTTLNRATQTCSHRKLEVLSSTSTSTAVATSSTCYKWRTVSRCRCTVCKRTGFITYGKWNYVKKHNYKLFGKTCTVCGYTK